MSAQKQVVYMNSRHPEKRLIVEKKITITGYSLNSS